MQLNARTRRGHDGQMGTTDLLDQLSTLMLSQLCRYLGIEVDDALEMAEQTEV